MRLAMVATPAALPDLRPAPGSLDGDVVRSRLPLPEASFLVVDLDPAVDVAEQIELYFDREPAHADEPILFYASCGVILSADGELFLCFDPTQPDTGDSLRDIALVFRERARGPVAFVLECRHPPDADPLRSASIVGAAKECVAAADGAIELLVAARPMDRDRDDRASHLTRALVEALDDPHARGGLDLADVVDAARESPSLVDGMPSFAHVRASAPFELVPRSSIPPSSRRTPYRAPLESIPVTLEDLVDASPFPPQVSAPPAIVEARPIAVEKPRAIIPQTVPAPALLHVDLPPPRAPMHSIEVSFDLDDDDTERNLPPIIEPPPPSSPKNAAPPPSAPPIVVSALSKSTPPPAAKAPSKSTPPPASITPPKSAPPFAASIPPSKIPPPPASIPPSKIPPPPSSAPSPSAPSPSAPPKSAALPSAPPKSAASPSAPSPSAPPSRITPTSEPPSLRAAAAVLPNDRSFRKAEGAAPARVVLSEPPSAPKATVPPGPSLPPTTASENVTFGDRLRSAGDAEGALGAYKRALGMLPATSSAERAEIYARLGQIKQAQDKRREAIANYEKALSLFPASSGLVVPETARAAMEALLDLNLAEGDARGIAAAEDQLLAVTIDPEERFTKLVTYATRWQDEARDAARARSAFERARAIKADDPTVLERLAPLYAAAGMPNEAFATRRRLAEITREPRKRAERYFALGRSVMGEPGREALGLELLDLALESDPTMLEPLAIVARVFADRQEWSQLEQAYRRMLERCDLIPSGPVRLDITWELCRRLGLLFRDHLEDPALALDAFEDAVQAKPTDLPTLLIAANLARTLGRHERCAVHMMRAATIEPTRPSTYHDLFDAFQKLRRPDQAYAAASVTMFLRAADTRERFIFEEHKPTGVPKPLRAIGDRWEFLRRRQRDVYAEAVLEAVTPAAIAVRLAQLALDGQTPELDPATLQDPEKSTVSIVRSFAWAAHFLVVPAPAIHLIDDPDLTIAAVPAEAPTVLAGQRVMRGRSLPELAFLVGRHLAYHVGAHRLLLYYPTIEELTSCFLAAIRIVLPEVPVPSSVRTAVSEIERGITLRLSETSRVDLAAAVAAFEKAGSRAHLAEWVADVERCSTRAGFLLAGDLAVAAAVLRDEPSGVLDADAKIADLLAFAVSDEHHALREVLGIAIQD